MFEVEENVPLHRKVRQKNSGIPFEKLEKAGQSMFIPETAIAGKTVKTSAQRYRKVTGIKLSVQQETGGCRIYRV